MTTSIQPNQGGPSFQPDLGMGQNTPATTASATTQRKVVDFEVLAQAHADTMGSGKTAANANLPTPTLFTAPASTMQHLGALGDNQTSADMFTFMALFQKMAQQMRDTARTQRTADMQAQVGALKGAAAEMKNAAESRFTAAIVQGSLQIAGGLVQMGTAAHGAKQTIKGVNQDAAGKGMFTEARQGAKMMGQTRQNALRDGGKDLMNQGAISKATGDKYQSFAQASSGITGGLGALASAGITLQADLADARRSELEAQAKVFETGVQHANDTMQQMMDVIRDVRDKVQSMQQSAIETNRAIARNI